MNLDSNDFLEERVKARTCCGHHFQRERLKCWRLVPLGQNNSNHSWTQYQEKDQLQLLGFRIWTKSYTRLLRQLVSWWLCKWPCHDLRYREVSVRFYFLTCNLQETSVGSCFCPPIQKCIHRISPQGITSSSIWALSLFIQHAHSFINLDYWNIHLSSQSGCL